MMRPEMMLPDLRFPTLMRHSFLKAYVECGLQAKWVRYSQVKYSFNRLRTLAPKWTVDESTDMKVGPILGHLLTTSHSKQGSFVSASTIPAEPIHVDRFFTLAKPLFYVLVIPAIVFLSELFPVWAPYMKQQIQLIIRHIFMVEGYS